MKQISDSWQVIWDSLAEWWYSWIILMILNMLLALCWITVVLGPPATFGLYHATYSLVTTHSTNWREFVEGIKQYFFKSWLWMLLNIGIFLLLRINLAFYTQFPEAGILVIISLFIGALWFSVQFYTLAYVIQQEQKQLPLALRNGLFTLLASPLYSLVLLLFVTFVLWISLQIPILFVIGSPALIIMISINAVRERLKTFNILRQNTDQSL